LDGYTHCGAREYYISTTPSSYYMLNLWNSSKNFHQLNFLKIWPIFLIQESINHYCHSNLLSIQNFPMDFWVKQDILHLQKRLILF
jgi:hypothetical protein